MSSTATFVADKLWSYGELRTVADLTPGHAGVDLIPVPGIRRSGSYEVCFAVSDRSIAEALRVRFATFNVELGEGLQESWSTGLDRDQFDLQMSHLVLVERDSHAIVGTYRLQTEQQAREGVGFYSAQEYDLERLGQEILPRAVEAGRACLLPGHRNMQAIVRLWLGMSGFMRLYEQRYLFGCCSITTTDPDDGWRALKTVRAGGFLHPLYTIEATPEFSCGDPARERDPELGPALKLPKLFRTYCRLGAQVVSRPAIDKEFGTVDFLMLMDGGRVSLSMLDQLLD